MQLSSNRESRPPKAFISQLSTYSEGQGTKFQNDSGHELLALKINK